MLRIVEAICVGIVAFTMLAMCAVMQRARAHSWYEHSCCYEYHCKPVADGVVTDEKDGVRVEGHGLLSYSDSRLRWSQDNGDHVCQNGGKLLCVYRRFKGI